MAALMKVLTQLFRLSAPEEFLYEKKEIQQKVG